MATNEKIMYIPARQKNAAVGGHVAGTEDIIDDALGKEQNQINAETNERISTLEENVGTGGSVDERIAAEGAKHYLKEETYNKTELNNMITTPNQEYVTVATYASLPVTGSADTVYRVSNYNGSISQVDTTMYSEYAWDGIQYVFLCVKSQIEEVFDITAYNSNTKYADLAAALGTNGANVPANLRKGGMSVKFVCSSDNKYVQYRLMVDTFNTTPDNWQGVDDEPIAGSDNLVKSGGVMEGDIAVETLIDGKQLLSAPIDGYNRLPIQTLKAEKSYILTNEGDAPIYANGYAFFNSGEATVLRNRIDGSQEVSDNIPKGGWEEFYVIDDVVEINIRFSGFNGIFSIKESVNRIKELQAKDAYLQEQIDTNAFESNQKKQFEGSAWTDHEYSISPGLSYTIKQISSGSILAVEAKDSDGNNVAVSGFTTLSNIGESCDIKAAKDATILRVYHNGGAAFEIKNNIQDYALAEISNLQKSDEEISDNIEELNKAVFEKEEFTGSGWSSYFPYSFKVGYSYKITNISSNVNSKIIALELRKDGRVVTYGGDSITNLVVGETATIIPNGDAEEFRAYFHDGEGLIKVEGTLEIVPSVYKLLDDVEIQESYSSKDSIKHQVIVSKTGEEGYFSTIADAYASITDSSYTNQYEVIVYPGKYNEVNLQVPPFTHTHAAFPNSVVVTSEGFTTTQPVFDQAYGSSKLSDITIVSYTGYCIHFDYLLSGQVLVNENLVLDKAGVGAGASNWSIIGGGTFYDGVKFIWKNCVFKCIVESNAACHTNGNQVNGNTHLIFDGCIFINCYPSIGSVGGSGNYVCEIANCSFPIGTRGLSNWFSPIRNIEDPTLYRFEKNEWNIIGGGNKNLSMWQSISGKTIRLVADYPITISGTAASMIFGYNPTINNVKTARLNCTLTSEYYIADEQAGYPPYSEVIDVFQLWKRLGDCSTTNKTLTITVNDVSKTYTFTENYLSTKTTQATIIAAMQAVLDNVTIEAITQSGYGYFNVNTSDCMMVKVMSDDILKGEFVTNDGYKATSATAIKDIVGIACEDKPHGEYVKVWTSAFRFDTDYVDGEYGLDVNGALDANAVNKIGFVNGYNFYLY